MADYAFVCVIFVYLLIVRLVCLGCVYAVLQFVRVFVFMFVVVFTCFGLVFMICLFVCWFVVLLLLFIVCAVVFA